MPIHRTLRICFAPEHLQRTGLITVVVGTWLTLFNQGDLMMAGNVAWLMALKIALNYATPFVVANAGLLSRQEGS